MSSPLRICALVLLYSASLLSLACSKRQPSETVAKVLEDPNACSVRTLSEADRSSATDEQKRLLQIREEDCSRRTTIGRCEAVVERLSRNQLTAEDHRSFGPDGFALAGRIQTGDLLAADLADGPEQLPCGARTFKLFAFAARRSAAAWRHVETVSEALLDDLGAGETLSDASSKMLTRRLDEALGKRPLEKLSEAELGAAVRICTIAKRVRVTAPPACQAAEKRQGVLAQNNAELQRELDREAKLRALDRCRSACFTRTVHQLEKEGQNSNEVGGGTIGMTCEMECRTQLGLPPVF